MFCERKSGTTRRKLAELQNAKQNGMASLHLLIGNFGDCEVTTWTWLTVLQFVDWWFKNSFNYQNHRKPIKHLRKTYTTFAENKQNACLCLLLLQFGQINNLGQNYADRWGICCISRGREAWCHRWYPHTRSRTFGALWGYHSYHNTVRPDVQNVVLLGSWGALMISVS